MTKNKTQNHPRRMKLTEWEGRRFTRLIVVGYVNHHRSQGLWLCRCDCGRELVVRGSNLITKNTKSCGCLAKEVQITLGKNLPRRILPLGHAQKNSVLALYKCRAKRKGYDWNLTEEQFENLVSGECHYCGDIPANKACRVGSNGAFIYNGIDRLDNSKGYECDNVVSCCKICNFAKNDMNYGEFMTWIARVTTKALAKKSKPPVY